MLLVDDGNSIAERDGEEEIYREPAPSRALCGKAFSVRVRRQAFCRNLCSDGGLCRPGRERLGRRLACPPLRVARESGWLRRGPARGASRKMPTMPEASQLKRKGRVQVEAK